MAESTGRKDAPLVSPTLFGNLTQLIPETTHHVTKLLTELLEVIASDACDTKRSQHALYWTVSTFRDCIQQINNLVVTANDESNESWDAFKNYTTMIPKLEGLLLEFCNFSSAESLRKRAPSEATVQLDIQFIDDWKQARDELRKHDQLLLDWERSGEDPAEKLKREENFRISWRYDDTDLYRSISRQWVERRGASDFPKIKQQLDAISVLDTLSDELTTQFLRSTMIIDVSLSARADNVAAMADSEELWDAIRGLVNAVEKAANGGAKTIDDIASAYQALVDILTKELPVALPESYIKLRSLFKSIVRPYYARTLVLVLECHALELKFGEDKTHKRRRPFNEAVQKTVEMLEAVARVTYDPKTKWDGHSPTDQIISAAEASVKDCLNAYHVDTATFDANLEKARQEDTDRLARIYERFSKLDPAKTNRANSVEVQVAVGANKTTYSVEPSSTLSALAWLVTSALSKEPSDDDLRKRGVFTVEGKVYDSDTTVESLQEKGAERDLVFSVLKSTQENAAAPQDGLGAGNGVEGN